MWERIRSAGVGALVAKVAVSVVLLGVLGLVLGWWQWPSTSNQAVADVPSLSVRVVAGAQVGEACEAPLDISIAPDGSGLICSDRAVDGSKLSSRVWREAADEPHPDTDLGQYLRELETELADNPAYVVIDEQELDERAGVGFSYVGTTYCEEYGEGGIEAVVRNMGYVLRQADHGVWINDQLRERGGPSEDYVIEDFTDMYLAAFWAADEWLCPGLNMGHALVQLEDDKIGDLMDQGMVRYDAEFEYTNDIEFMLQPDPANGWFGLHFRLYSQQWVDLGWFACDELDRQEQRSFFEATRMIGTRILDAEPDAGSEAPWVAGWVLGNGVEHLCPEYLSSHRAWDTVPDGPLVALLETSLASAIDTLEASTGTTLGDERLSYEAVQILHPILGKIGAFTLFNDYALEIDAGSALEVLGSAYELVWASGLMPTDTAISDLADAAAALTVAIATQNSPGLLVTLVAGR